MCVCSCLRADVLTKEIGDVCTRAMCAQERGKIGTIVVRGLARVPAGCACLKFTVCDQIFFLFACYRGGFYGLLGERPLDFSLHGTTVL